MIRYCPNCGTKELVTCSHQWQADVPSVQGRIAQYIDEVLQDRIDDYPWPVRMNATDLRIILAALREPTAAPTSEPAVVLDSRKHCPECPEYEPSDRNEFCEEHQASLNTIMANRAVPDVPPREEE